MEDRLRIHEEDVAFDLLVEGVWDVDVGRITGSRLLPFTADTTCVTDLRQVSQDFLGDACSFQESLHLHCAGMPPADMQLPKSRTDVRFIVSTK